MSCVDDNISILHNTPKWDDIQIVHGLCAAPTILRGNKVKFTLPKHKVKAIIDVFTVKKYSCSCKTEKNNKHPKTV